LILNDLFLEVAVKVQEPIGRLPDANALTRERYDQQQDNVTALGDYWATTPAREITRRCLPELAEGLKKALRATDNIRAVNREFLALIRPSEDNGARKKRGLNPETLALCILRGALQSIGKNETYSDTASLIGNNIRMECLRAKIVGNDPKLLKRIHQHVKAISGSKKRQQRALRDAERHGYKTDEWNEGHFVEAGNWAINQLLQILPKVFVRDDESGREKHLTLTPEATIDAESITEEAMQADPVWPNAIEPPPPWTGWNEGGSSDLFLQKSRRVVRTRNKQTETAVRRAISSGDMKPALDALNSLQAVPWAINKEVLKVLRACVAQNIHWLGADGQLHPIKGLPGDKLPKLETPDLSKLDADRVKVWKDKELATRRYNRRNRNDLLGLAADLKTAEYLADHERFYTPMNLDWRGRVNPLPHFNFIRDDRVRALFLFADGEPIGERGRYWRKVHMANRGDCNKISKQPFDARIAWVDEHQEKIRRTALTPLEMVDWWAQADEPFQFLASCFELAEALSAGSSYVCRLPVSFDGACNGLQHLCAMMKAPEGELVNLTDNERPQDIYQTVAERTRTRIKNDTREEKADYRTVWLAFDQREGISRSTVKQNVMTYGYSGTKSGMAQQQIDDLIEPRDTKAFLDDRPRPFGAKREQRWGAAYYLAEHVYAAIEEVVEGPAKAKDFLRALSNAASDANKPLRWTTPVGLPWINRYHEPFFRRIDLWLFDRPTPYTTKRIVGEKPKIDREEAADGASPNFVHACDAAHLMLTVRAAAAEGIKSIATVHDCFACLPSQAERFRQIILEQFVQMYKKHDVLQKILDQAYKDLPSAKGLPEKPPDKGDLKIEEVLRAEYSFA
jgi:DNA-directed RNA polymerase, mitochondrial